MFRYKIRVLLMPAIIVIIAVLICVILLNVGRTSVDNVQMDAIINGLLTISTDLELQHETVAKTAYSISKQNVYKPSYVKAHKYHEVELLENIVSLSRTNSFSDEYFLMYRGERDVYKAENGAKNTFEVFAKYYNIDDESENLYEKLSTVSGFTVIPYKSYSKQNCIFAMPVFAEGNLSGNIIATLGVLISGSELSDRYQSMLNYSYDNVYIFYDDSLILTFSEHN
ncbi:MAG: hypothetical protein GX633_08575, partial [Clostridiales bacterium]|nr:hypothetical protein [Clostridiales bacterium]